MADSTNPMLSLTALTVDNATAALEHGLAAIRAGATAFDLSNVVAVDSAAVSVMLAWQRAAHAAGVPLRLENLPPMLASLTKLYGVCSLVSPQSPAATEPAAHHHH